ncbi:MAG: type I DNA topoisomerase [Candidatus Izemoplasmatales bacterium]|jgi:DNA topoisomerase-1
MATKLVIVESPSKSKTIGQYLGDDYIVKSSKGHIRDLAISGPGGLGIDVNHDFKPEYQVLADKKEIVKDLNKALKSVKEVYLATDPDREGEAISWHLYDTLDVKDKYLRRVIFNEITKTAILEAFAEPKDIDMNLVSSQETRRIIDRIIGFKLSKLLQSKIKSKSAGRVQSAALKLIVDKELEIDKFVIEEYYDIFATFPNFDAKLVKYAEKPAKISTLASANKIIDHLGPMFQVRSCDTKRRNFTSKPPFITSTMQQEASQRLNFTAQKTMQIAQKLYEGIQVGEELVGLITYMRTDSVRLSSYFLGQAEDYIQQKYGKNYLGHFKKETSTNKIQDAHEAIRPTDIKYTPEKIKTFLSRDELQLYKLIFNRAIASLMKAAQYDVTTIDLENKDALFRTSGRKLVFDGYQAVYGKEDDDTEDKILPSCVAGLQIEALKVEAKQMFTIPPARYTEARLIKEMEDLGIGRPSTYAQTIQTLKNRKYVTIKEKKFIPSEQGKKTISSLEGHFHEFISANYSKTMEDTLDLIAEGQDNQLQVISNFYAYFIPLVDTAFKDIKKEKPRETGETCPKCGSPMVVRHGRYGEFEACSNYPTCKYIKQNPEQEKAKPIDTKVKCPSCNKGTLLVRTATKGKNKGHHFLGCSTYPRCKYIAPFEALDDLCPLCGKLLVKETDGRIRCIDDVNCGFVFEE